MMKSVVTIVLACAACGGASAQDAARYFSRASFCPAERVRATPRPELALRAPDAELARVPEWREPVPPAELLRDPARMRMWNDKRDAEYASWLAMRHSAASRYTYSYTTVFEIVGCGTTAVYSCAWYSCEQITDAARLACRDNSTPIAQGVPPTLACVRGREPYDLALSPRDCAASCAKDDPRCPLACLATAHQTCEARGFDRFGLCAPFAEAEAGAEKVAREATDAGAKAAALHAAADDLRANADDMRTCATACPRASSRALTECMVGCATTSRERCERSAPTTSWCEGFRTAETAMQRQLAAVSR